MVSLGSTALLGLGAIALFFFLNRGNLNSVTPESNGIKTTVSESIPIITEIMENPQIQILKDGISQINSFIKNTFKPPILTKGLTTGGKTFPCRGPNCLGIFQAKGTRSGFDPFTGQRIALAGSTQFQNITKASFDINNQLIASGGVIRSQIDDLLSGLKNELNILQTNSV